MAKKQEASLEGILSKYGAEMPLEFTTSGSIAVDGVLGGGIADGGMYAFWGPQGSKGDGGKDFSYIKVTPSNQVFDAELMEKIKKVQEDKVAIEAMWQLIDRSTSLTKEEYIKLLADEAQQNGGTGRPAVAAPAPRPQIAGYEVAPKPEIPGNDFGDGGDTDFND